MKTQGSRYLLGAAAFLLALLFACTPSPQPLADRDVVTEEPAQLKAAASESASPGGSAVTPPAILPVRFQSPSYTLADDTDAVEAFGVDEDFVVKVGADISSTTGPVMLRNILKKLASHKNMNISWASDVNQYAYVDVDIRANDDFFKAIDNLLRQRDYFHEVEGNTIVVKYKETKRFHLAMPFVASTYDTSIGANVTANSKMKIASVGNTFDIWANIKENLDQVLNIWEESASIAPAPADGDDASVSAKVTPLQAAKSFYIIDKPVGIITVTAPRRIIERVESYLDNLKAVLYRQIYIEAKILEVNIVNESNVGINWKNLLNNVDSTWGVKASMGDVSWSNPFGPSGQRALTVTVPNFTMLINALEEQGKTRILSNPRLSVMNGQPALINVGKEVTYIDKVTKSISETGEVTFSPTTATKTSGIVMSVVPIIMDNDDIIISLTPVISNLEEPIEYRTFADGTQVGLPKIHVKEMSTMIRVKKGETLIIGGLIDTFDDGQDTDVSVLSKLPLIGRLFSHKSKTKTRKELVILLRPEII